MTQPFKFPELIQPPGWFGHFTRESADGALPAGTMVRKTNSEAGDGSPDGTKGVILGSIRHPEIRGNEPLYFAEWATLPRRAVACMAFKLEVDHA